jgi:hypothetical protein
VRGFPAMPREREGSLAANSFCGAESKSGTI